MSATPKPKAVAMPASAAAVPVQDAASVAMLNVLAMFDPEALAKMMVEAFALAFERKMQGTSFELLTNSLQLAADLRVFKEGEFLTREQVCRMLQIGEDTFRDWKKRAGIEVDNSLGTHNPRYALHAVIAAQQRLTLEAAGKAARSKARIKETGK